MIGDESTYQASCHGLSQDPDKIFEHTKKSTMKSITNDLRFNNPHIVYKQNAGKVRNLKQLQNAKYYLNLNKRIHLDDIAAVHLIHTDLKFVKNIETAPDLIIIAYDDELVEEINNMMAVYNGTVMATYDTTFNVGDFYLSVLLVKHHLLKSEPVVPLVYMFHDRKLETTHKDFFTVVKKVFY